MPHWEPFWGKALPLQEGCVVLETVSGALPCGGGRCSSPQKLGHPGVCPHPLSAPHLQAGQQDQERFSHHKLQTPIFQMKILRPGGVRELSKVTGGVGMEASRLCLARQERSSTPPPASQDGRAELLQRRGTEAGPCWVAQPAGAPVGLLAHRPAPPHAPTPYRGIASPEGSERCGRSSKVTQKNEQSLRAYGPPTPARTLQATWLTGIPGPRFPHVLAARWLE